MPGFAHNGCTYGVKIFVLVCAVAGLVCSILAARNCNFISFRDTDGNPPDRADEPPFNSAIAGSLGIFGYIITEVFNGGGPGTDGCVAYEQTFGQQTAYPSLATAQFCALIAPIFGGIAIFCNLADLFVCNFAGSFMITSLVYAIACGLQAATFTLLADPAFCFEDTELQCETGQGAHLSIAATVLFGVASLFMCCAPRSDPFCYNFGMEPERKNPPPEPQVILQPVIIHTEAPAPESPTKKKKKMKAQKEKKSNISSNV